MRAALLGSLVVIAVLSCAPRAWAESNAAAAQALFEEARTLMANGNYTAACAKLEGSEGLDRGAGTEYTLALCYEKSGRSASAWAMYLTAAASYAATNRADWETKARDRAAALAGSLSKVTIVVPAGAPRDLQITRDGATVSGSELGTSIPLDPGHHVVEAIAAGRPKSTSAFDLAPGTSKTITIALAEPTAPVPEPPSGGGSGLRTLGLVLGGVGVAGLGVGTVTGLVAIGKNSSSKNACPNDGPCADPDALHDNASASDWATVSTVSFIAGGVLAAAGAVLFFTAPSGSGAPRAFVAPSIGLGTAGVVGAW